MMVKLMPHEVYVDKILDVHQKLLRYAERVS